MEIFTRIPFITAGLAILYASAAVASTQHAYRNAWPKDRGTIGLPIVFEGDDARVDRSETKVERTDHLDTGTTAAVVGIQHTGTKLNGELFDAVGTGFLVGPCQVVTAAHVVTGAVVKNEMIEVGWGAPPAGASRAAYDLAQNFSNRSKARLLWMGALNPDEKAVTLLNLEKQNTGWNPAEYGRVFTADWAVLELETCPGPKVAPFQLPLSLDAAYNDSYTVIARPFMVALGYPGGEFDKVTMTRCLYAPMQSESGDTLVDCKIRGGNSGGPILPTAKSNLARGITSYATSYDVGADARFVSTATAAFALKLGKPEPTPPGCVLALKRLMREHILEIDPASPLDDSPDAAFLSVYRWAAQSLAGSLAPNSGTFLQALPDPFMCDTLRTYVDTRGSMNPPSKPSDGVPEGTWHWQGLGLSVKRVGGVPVVALTGNADSGPILNFLKQETFFTGRRLQVTVDRSPTGQPAGTTWTIDFRPGRPPLLVSRKSREILSNTSRVFLEWMEPGLPR